MACTKFRFPTRGEAEDQAKKYKADSRENRKVLNRLGVYQCHDCLVPGTTARAWHVGHNKFKGSARKFSQRKLLKGIA